MYMYAYLVCLSDVLRSGQQYGDVIFTVLLQLRSHTIKLVKIVVLFCCNSKFYCLDIDKRILSLY